MRNTDILIVDDEVGIRDLLSEILQDEGYGVCVAENAEVARQLRHQTRPAMVLLDIWMPDCDGITLLKEWANEGQLNMPVVMMSGHASIDTAVEATKIGALDFLEKPIGLQKLLSTVERALKYSKMQEESSLSLDKLGQSQAIKKMRMQLEAASSADTVLLVGEAGSPFDQAAQYFQRGQSSWVAPSREQWMDPAQDWVKKAHNGVLYLGDISQYDREAQLSLLAALSRRDRFHLRVVSATSRSLPELIADPNYDDRLIEQVSGFIVTIPPLRAQEEDIEYLVHQILARLVESKQVRMVRFNPEALNALRQYSWPGNIGQLKLVIKSLALGAQQGEVDSDQVVRALEQQHSRYGDNGGFDFNLPLRELREEVEKRYFEYHIRREGSNMSQVAQRVGLERTHLYRKLKQLGIQVGKRQSDKNNEK